MDKLIAALVAFWEWFTPARRRKAYKIAGLIGMILVTRGLVSAKDVADVLEVIALALGVVGVPALANGHVNDE